jgi:hypothetical protein
MHIRRGCSRFWCGTVVVDGVGERRWRDRLYQGLGWMVDGTVRGGRDRLEGMVDGILEIGMWGEMMKLDSTINLIMDARVHLTESDIHTMVVAYEGTSKGAAVSTEGVQTGYKAGYMITVDD